MSNNDIMTHSAAIEWAPAMVPVLADRALEAERLRRLPEETIADFDAAAVWRLVVPERLGGHGHGLRTMTAVAEALAHGCTSTAWTTSFLIMHNWFVLRSGAALQEELFATRPWV